MAEVTAQEEGRFASEIPSKHLPPVPYADLPEPLSLRKILGPSIILLGVSIGSGEFVLWPYITSQVGLVAMWAAIIGVLTQYFINMEIERYTLATGETAITGFTRLWKPWAVLFIIMTIVPWAWPGWATGASTALTFVFGGGNVVLITILALVAIGIALTVSPVVYQFVEKLQMVFVLFIFAFILIAVFAATTAQAWGDFVTGFSNFGRIPPEIGTATLLGALAFAGAGGTVNLVQSNWIRDKGMGMGARIPRIVSPVTGEEEAAPSTGYFFPQNEENIRRWNGWWRVANWEQFLTFFVLGTAGIIALSVLTYSTVPVGEVQAQDFDFIRLEGEALSRQVAPWFGIAFWLAGAVVLFSTNLGLLDMVGRVTADILKVNWLRQSTFWSESKIYFAVVWAEIAFGSIILLAGLEAPVVLLVISAALNGLVMFIYSALLFWLNRRVLPDIIKLNSYRLVAIAWAVLFFGYFSAVTIIDQGKSLFGG